MAYYTKTQMTPSRTTPTLSVGTAISGYPAPYYYQDPTGRVYFGGSITGQTSGTTLFTLPAGMRPVTNLVFMTVLLSGGGSSFISVSTSGAVNTGSTTAEFWDGANFMAGL
jgi:hypothetical protein